MCAMEHDNFAFKKYDVSKCIQVSDDGLTLQRTTKDNLSFKAAVADVGFNEGYHTWEFTINRMEYKTMFFGVVKKPIDVEKGDTYYNGSGWLLSTYNLHVCHNSHYGKEFALVGTEVSTDQAIGIRLDLDEHTLSFYMGSKSLGVAFRGLPEGETFFPCVLLSCAGQTVTASFPQLRRPSMYVS